MIHCGQLPSLNVGIVNQSHLEAREKFQNELNTFLRTGVIRIRLMIDQAFETRNSANVLVMARILSDLRLRGHISTLEYESSMILMKNQGFNLPEMTIEVFKSEKLDHLRCLTIIMLQLENADVSREYLRFIKACFPQRIKEYLPLITTAIESSTLNGHVEALKKFIKALDDGY